MWNGTVGRGGGRAVAISAGGAETGEDGRAHLLRHRPGVEEDAHLLMHAVLAQRQARVARG